MSSPERPTETINQLGGPGLFERSPFRHPYFAVATFLLVCVTGACAVIVVWARLPLVLDLWLVSALCFFVPAWAFALRTHKRIQKIARDGLVSKPGTGSPPLDVALAAASETVNMQLCFALAGALIFLSVLTEIVHFR